MLEELQSGPYQRAKENKDALFNTLHDKIYRMDVLEEAWKIVSENKGTAGIDRQSISDIETAGVDQFLAGIQSELRKGTYKAECVRRVFIPKANGKKRPLGIPTVRDRIVQQAVKLIIEPIFEADFKEFSYAYRKGKSAKEASQEIYKWMNFGLTTVIDIDIQGFFDHLDHELLISFVKKRVRDGYVISLIMQWLKAGVVYMNTTTNPIEGTPQGGVISPLLANIYLNELDHAWTDMGMDSNSGQNAHMVRYSDDLVILTNSPRSAFFKGKAHAENVMNVLKSILKGLKMNLSPEKSRITTAEEGFDFLGFHFMRKQSKEREKEVTLFFPSKRSKSSFMRKASEITHRNHAHTKSEDDVINELNLLIRGWTGYFNHSHASRVYSGLWNFVCFRVTQFMRYQHKRRHLAIDYIKLRSRGLLPLNGRIEHLYSIDPGEVPR